MLLTDKVAFVTGGAGRLGRAIVTTFAREGAAVVLADLDPARAEEAAREISGKTNGRVIAVTGDVSQAADVARMVEEATQAVGLPDILVNAHGIFPNVPVLDVDPDVWDRIFAVNVRGSMLPAQALARRWITNGVKGSIVNISSGASRSARAGGAGYAGSKAAVNLLTETLAIELGPHGIRVNAVAPGLIMDNVVTEESDALHPYVNMTLRGTPMGRTGHANDIAEAVAFLASERSAWTTGAILEVTGGTHCGRTYMPTTQGLR
ncbi:SDR family NAD(P)-dependent oxidoreductase [Microvirga antarctica]|uniref:SDR family NAD(P)-dependent oxidoreductase n=1 Tax=Microvirga antarctica TaxID=2819233 RepID=UPI001B311C13|nr:glucose 1-dehydrogenase [Microvirga antarctica]